MYMLTLQSAAGANIWPLPVDILYILCPQCKRIV
ncbi:Hypothetical protein NGAL_HAMBI2427_05270 [Neorhizobium galegae bv. orientalis]|uniref:Uncharacterized protein n=1 Tax=Neorhizobium galegae bv. orientalis str. HAMBI 540 TaxID=1028800 RepID=A0A068T0M8_NEOGA|nr:Hypothetical protein RG540_PA03420 [Neorhizobium galegae bv. orientalis str. HAMBI 540]CDZ44037.1 Hypothetical protein NGAL_HAMBI2427_05270 [Neorhizobium galegae bv. orientalis]